MVMRLRLALLLLLPLLLAGCASLTEGGEQSPAAHTAPGALESANEEDRNVTTLDPIAFHIPAGATLARYSNPEGGYVELPADAVQVLVEAQWTCSSPACALTLGALYPDASRLATGTHEARLVLVQPPAGKWNMAMHMPEVATGQPGLLAEAKGEIRVTVFTAGRVPQGYSAFDGAS